ncbi:hypothetical protein GCM10023085_04730 [Actinomadura viridis]|uniref:Uncharacterized protein n=1 Tax=Actinomadura viridis TaxID=58110 RepID=A0A931DPA4_9ACTN|nr:hypothetical protein [Actinomadura viridis]MBG6091291.1 hypothetical protein [Actinomadura viridis]
MVTSAPRTRRTPRRTPRRTGGGTGGRTARWTAWGLMAGGAAMVPWTGVLAARLPSTTTVSHWSTAWAGLDALVATGLLTTGVLMARGDVRHGLTAAATGSLLVMDAWFDVTTAAPGAGRRLAVALAVGAELPVAAVCAALALRALAPHAKHVHERPGQADGAGRRPAVADSCPRRLKETDETDGLRPLE